MDNNIDIQTFNNVVKHIFERNNNSIELKQGLSYFFEVNANKPIKYYGSNEDNILRHKEPICFKDNKLDNSWQNITYFFYSLDSSNNVVFNKEKIQYLTSICEHVPSKNIPELVQSGFLDFISSQFKNAKNLISLKPVFNAIQNNIAFDEPYDHNYNFLIKY